MVGADEAVPYNPGDVVSEYVGHQHIGVFAISHAHRIGHDIHNIKVGMEQSQCSIE